MSGELIGAAIGALGTGAATAIVYSLANRKKTGAESEKLQAEATDIITSTAVELLQKAVEDADRSAAREQKLMSEVIRLERKVDQLSRAVSLLVQQLQQADVQPDPQLVALLGGSPPMPPAS